MGLFSWLGGGEKLSEADQALVPTIEEAEAALARGDCAASLEAAAACRPENPALEARLLDIRVRAALALRDVMSLESLAAQAERLGEARPDKARLLMLEAEAKGAPGLALALARGAKAGGESVDKDLARLEGSKGSPKTVRKTLLAHATQALANDYEDVRLMGMGQSTFVVSAVRRLDSHRLACKFLHPSVSLDERARQRFVREAEVLASLDHPSILKFLGVHRQEPFYFVTEFFPGSDLDTLLAQGKLFRNEEVARLGYELAEGVAHAHKAGVIHRDIQPGNVLLDGEGRIRLIDFGMARLREGEGVTVRGSAMGGWEHQPPEVFGGSAEEPTEAMDVFGIGATLYHMLLGGPPYVEVRGLVRERGPSLDEVAKGVPEPLRDAIETALAEEPGERWESVARMRARLMEAMV